MDHILETALQKHKNGRFEEAIAAYHSIIKKDKNHGDANHNLGILFFQQYKFDIALQHLETALRKNPEVVQYWRSYVKVSYLNRSFSNLKKALEFAEKLFGNTKSFYSLIEWLDAELMCLEPKSKSISQLKTYYEENNFHKILEISETISKKFPNSFLVNNYVGGSCYKENKLENAILNFEELLKINPFRLDGYFNLSSCYEKKGDNELALKIALEANKYFPNSQKVALKLGRLFEIQDNDKSAQHIYMEALKNNPKNSDFILQIANISYKNGHYKDAIDWYLRIFKYNLNNETALYNFGNVISQITCKTYSEDTDKVIVKLLTQNTLVRPSSISDFTVNLLKCKLSKYLLMENNIKKNEKVFINLLDSLKTDSLMKVVLSTTLINDLELEKFLIFLRSGFLKYSKNLTYDDDLQDFLSAFARQVFLNEYIYHTCEVEQNQIADFISELKEINFRKNPLGIILLSIAILFVSIESISWITNELRNKIQKKLKIKFIKPKNQPTDFRSSIKSIGVISNQISKKVRKQYEDYPYPRWLQTKIIKNPIHWTELSKNTKIQVDKLITKDRTNILVVGCGTGQHSIGTATKFKNCHVTAIDLSWASLEYAQRKTIEYGIKNIEYIQADLEDFSKLKYSFDIIEVMGVLHHTNAPVENWQKLTRLLKSGGIMRVGLYSTLARKPILKYRERFFEKNKDYSVKELLDARKAIIGSQKNGLERIICSSDFFSTSGFRDLLFHSHETTFSIQEIKGSLEKLKLEFCGFDGMREKNKFLEAGFTTSELYDLDAWDSFEKNFEDTFANMYQFWCQKI